MILASFYAPRAAHPRHRYSFIDCLDLQRASCRHYGVRQVVISDATFEGLPTFRIALAGSGSFDMVQQRGRVVVLFFGTGYSSLGYLRSFPFDKIKIDQSFIRDLSTKEDSVAIIRAVVGLSSSLGITTTAEGVETKEQLERLTSEGCDEVQGFLFSRPRPAAELQRLFGELAPPAEAVA